MWSRILDAWVVVYCAFLVPCDQGNRSIGVARKWIERSSGKIRSISSSHVFDRPAHTPSSIGLGQPRHEEEVYQLSSWMRRLTPRLCYTSFDTLCRVWTALITAYVTVFACSSSLTVCSARTCGIVADASDEVCFGSAVASVCGESTDPD